MPAHRASGPAYLTSRSAILDAIRAAGTISRVELARDAGLSPSTVTNVVRRLIADGLVVEAGQGASTGGKPRTLLQLDTGARYAVGVHLEQGGVRFVVTDLSGTIVARWRRPGAVSESPQDVVDRVAEDIRDNLARVDIGLTRVLGIGVVSPGPIFQHTRMTLTPPQMRSWSDFPLADALAAATGLPVMLENDATAAALGEYWSGAIGAHASFAALYMGTGIGAGVVIDGSVLRGVSSNAGEVGHVCLEVNGPPCWCGARGCVEVLAAPPRVVENARAAGFRLPGGDVMQDFAEIARAAGRGERTAMDVLHESAQYMAIVVQTIANLLDIERIVLTGPSFALAGSLYLPSIRAHLDEVFFARESHTVEVDISSNAPEAAAIGACSVVLQSTLSPRFRGVGQDLELVGAVAVD